MKTIVSKTINGHIIHIDSKQHLNPLADWIDAQGEFGVLETRWSQALGQGSIYCVACDPGAHSTGTPRLRHIIDEYTEKNTLNPTT